MVALLESYADARQRLLHAQTIGDRAAAELAEQDLEAAVADFHSDHERLASDWIAGFRLALEMNPLAVGQLLGQLPVPELLAEAVEDLEGDVESIKGRLDEVEDALLPIVGVLS